MGVAERREREKEQRRNHIIDAAEQVFRERGAVEATMADVAGRAELSKGTLYLYFQSKDDLYLAIASRALQALIDRLPAPAEAGDGMSELRALFAAQREVARTYPMRFQSVLAWMASGFHANHDSPDYAHYLALTQRLFSRVRGALERAQDNGAIRADIDPKVAGMQLWGGTFGIWSLYFNRSEVEHRMPHAPDFDRVVDTFADTLLGGLAPVDSQT